VIRPSPWAGRLIFFVCFISAYAICAGVFGAAEIGSARITRLIKEAKLSSAHAPTKGARINDEVRMGEAVETGIGSRLEMKFADRLVARMGANTICVVGNETAILRLNEGAILFEAPAFAAGEAKIKTGEIMVSLVGTTGIIERHRNDYVKILVLAGTARAYLNKIGESVLVNAGQMLITKPGAATLPDPVNFEIAQLYRTSLLTNGDFQPLASRAQILQEIQKQQTDPAFIHTNLVIHGRGTLVNLIPPKPASATARKPSPLSSPRPKSRTPQRIPTPASGDR
jgi:hypothetical protein